MAMTTTVSSKGQIVLPAQYRQEDDIRPGEEFDVQRVEPGSYLLKRRARRNEGVVKHLLECPVKGWFQPMDRSETTDDIPSPKMP